MDFIWRSVSDDFMLSREGRAEGLGKLASWLSKTINPKFNEIFTKRGDEIVERIMQD